MSDLQSVRYENGVLSIIDQRFLPGQVIIKTLDNDTDIYEAIKSLAVRGAPAIGIAAAFGLCVVARQLESLSADDFLKTLQDKADYLNSSRPTAVNLSWALQRMVACSKGSFRNGVSVSEIIEALEKEAFAIFDEDVAMCRSIGEHTLKLLKPNMGILTHCNAGWLATSRYGTALSPIYLGKERGYNFKVFADETRPLLQGARLTSFELMQAGVDVTLICDNMASYVMKQGLVQAVLVGADRITRSGDVANKIGTSGVAVLAKHYGIPFYVLAPSSTLDLNTESGSDIHIEQRDSSEITDGFYSQRMAPDNVKTLNPAFDVTDNNLITAIITENGILNLKNTKG